MVVSDIRVGSFLTSRILIRKNPSEIRIEEMAYFRPPDDWYLKALFKAGAIQLRVYYYSLVNNFRMSCLGFCNT